MPQIQTDEKEKSAQSKWFDFATSSFEGAGSVFVSMRGECGHRSNESQ
jgi:hypothetical protein